jgi:hypothetical protein
MKSLIAFLFFVSGLHSLSAHPGIGIVKDSRGNIYYTDLEQVWKIRNDGEKTIVVPNVHSHELYMDSADNLFGEHSWYNGEQSNTWGHYVWCLKNNGVLIKIKQPTAGFLENYSFVRDQKGNMYWAEHWKISRIKKKTPDGAVITLAEKKFKDIRWMHATPAGVLYFIDLTDLYKIDERGSLRLIFKNIHETDKISDKSSLKHYIFGIWLDKANNIYLAVRGAQVVKKISADGTILPVIHSTGDWSPTAGLFDDSSNLWLMESNSKNETRVRKIYPKELSGKRHEKKALKIYAETMIPGVAITAMFIAGSAILKKLLN